MFSCWSVKLSFLHEFNNVMQDNRSIKNSIVLYEILHKHTKLFDAIAKQKKILNLQERKCISIFISKDMFMELISNAAVYDHTQLDSLYPIMRDLGTPVGFLGNLPIYLSDLLDEAPVFVVGAISWSFEK